MGYTVLQANGRDKEGRQIIVPVENRTFPPGLQEREVVSSRNLTWVYVYHTCWLGQAALTGVRRQRDGTWGLGVLSNRAC